MRHVLLVSADEELLEGLRGAALPSTTFLPESDPEEALERLGRSARIDAVVTDDPLFAVQVRSEIPGRLPVHVVRAGESAAETLRALDVLLSG